MVGFDLERVKRCEFRDAGKGDGKGARAVSIQDKVGSCGQGLLDLRYTTAD